ncbi:MAG: hypothetical protein KIT84_10710 [Labilithrix sp.]|nr:hypothetical protein [Labilithrix sp.]MCW5811477.1 hypothetical protein [Labilithrix sp.]
MEGFLDGARAPFTVMQRYEVHDGVCVFIEPPRLRAKAAPLRITLRA